MKITHLRASSAHRWFPCPGSVRAEAIAPSVQEDGGIALEGTAAHRLFELCLKRKVDAETYIGEEIRLAREKTSHEVGEDMAEHIQDGVDLVRRRVGKGVFWSEAEVHISTRGAIVGGTLDAGWYGKYQVESMHAAPVVLKKLKAKLARTEHQLHIMDLKYGMLLVEAHDNKQMKIYAQGKLRELYAKKLPVDSVHMWIYQPRAASADGLPFQHVVVSPYDMVEFGMELQDAVDAARVPNAPLRAGPHCLYCKAHAVCPEAERAAMKAVRQRFLETDRARIGELLFSIPMISKWCDRVRGLGKQMGRDGTPPLEWKMVKGNKRRRFPGKEADQLRKVLPKLRAKFKFGDDEVAPRRLLSVSKVEKLLPKERREELERFYITVNDADRLVPEDDKRAAVSAAEFFEAEDDGRTE